MDINDEEFKMLEDDNKIESEEDIGDFTDFENFYGLRNDFDDDGEIKELEF